MKTKRHIKTMRDGRAMLNLGCGPRTHPEWNNMDFCPYASLAHRRRLARLLRAVGIMSAERYASLMNVDRDVIKWDIRKGIPFEDAVLDVVYHCHFIGHLDRDVAVRVTRECRRILKPGGVLRVVVPDLRQVVRAYTEAIEGLQRNRPQAWHAYRTALDDMFELMVRKEPVGTNKQGFLTRMIEKAIRGNISRRGELLRWHYDEYSMGAMLRDAGFEDVRPAGASDSRIEGWNDYHLDINEDGGLHKEGALYMEAVK